MSYSAAISSCFRHYFSFRGRAPRSEYWYWNLTILFINILLGAPPLLTGRAAAPEIVTHLPVLTVFWLVTFLPSFSIMVRRLHDVNKSSWWGLGSLIPFMNFYALYLLFFKRGTEGPNKFGDDPNEGDVTRGRVVQLGSTNPPPLERFSDEELARLLPAGRTTPKAANERSGMRVPITARKQATGFGRRGAGNHAGFRSS
nr:DUF805 domain-containing protein [uncultured Cohaesibacter sp.]